MAPLRCYLPNCRRWLKDNGLHTMPKKESYRLLWIDSIVATFPNIGDIRNICICSMHFKESDTFLTKGNRTRIRKDAVPSIFLTNPDLPDDLYYKALNCGFKFTTEKIKTKGDDEDSRDSDKGELSTNGEVLPDQEEWMDSKCPFLNTDNVALKFQWMKNKRLAGFEGDEEFLQFLLDEFGNIYKGMPNGVETAVAFDHPYSMKTEASSEQNGVELQHDDYLYSGVETTQEKIVETSSGRRIKPIKHPGEVLYSRSSDDENDEPERQKKPKILSIKDESTPSVKSRRGATREEDEEYAPTEFDAAFNSDEEEQNERAMKKSKDKRGKRRVPICPMCNFKMAAATKLDDEHAKTHLSDMFGSEKKCVICSEAVEDPLEHFWTHVFKAVACVECEVVIPNAGLFNYHECKEEKGGCSLRIHKSVEVPPDLVSIFKFYGPMVENQNNAGTSEIEKHQKILVYKCLLCEKRFKWIGKINQHMVSQHKDRVKPGYNCPTCGMLFYFSTHLDYHEINVHKVGERRCLPCGKIIPGKLFAAHMRGHKAKFPCEVCGKAMLDSTKLRFHMMIHTNTKPHACEFCDKRFVQKINRDQHQRLHTGEERYQCKFCHKKFIQSANYVQHLRKHTKEKARAKQQADSSS